MTLDLLQVPVLLLAPRCRLLIEEGSVHAAVELIHVHLADAVIKPLVFRLKPKQVWAIRARLELAGNLPAFEDGLVHPTINLENLDPECELPNLIVGRPEEAKRVDAILNNSFGMLGINSAVFIRRFSD